MESISSETVDAAQKEPEEDGKPSLHYWKSQLDAYDNVSDPWKRDIDDAFDEYLNDGGRRSSGNKQVTTHFPLFWSCVRTIQPAFYSRTPVIVTEKSFKEMQDPIARLSAVMYERLGKYLVKTSGFDRTMSLSVTHFIMSEKVTNRVIFDAAINDVHVPYEGADGQMMLNTEQNIDYIKCETETWHYKDARHTPNARHWGEIDWLSFDTLLTRKEVEETFGDVANELTYTPIGNSKEKDRSKEIKGLPSHFATITEIWDKKKRRVYYLSPGHSEWLTHNDNPDGDDPYKLKDFFPCPPFMLGTFGADDLFTRPAYVQLADFLDQVHGAFDRVRRLILALKKAGVFDASKPQLAELNAIASEGQFIGVADLEMLLGPNGSLDRLIHFFPTDKIAQGVNELKTAMLEFEQKVYDLWGIPDIYRGISDPNETLGAQQLKGKHMSVRFSVLQREVQRLARDTIEMMCDLYLQKCPEIKLAEIMGYKFMNQQTEAPLFYQALMMLKNDEERCVRLEIETDSTITQNLNADIEQKNYMAKTMFEGIGALKDVPPAFMPVAAKAVELTVQALREGKHIEDDLRQAMDAMQQAAQQPPPPPPPDPALAVEQLRQQGKQMELQAQAQEHQADLQLKFQELQLKAQELQVNMQLAREKLQVEMQKAGQEGQIETVKTQLDAQVKASEQRLDALRVEVEQYKAVLSEREKLLEEKRLAHDQQYDKDANILEAISLVTGKALPSDVRRKEEAANKKRKRKHTIKINDDDNSAVVETEEVND